MQIYVWVILFSFCGFLLGGFVGFFYVVFNCGLLLGFFFLGGGIFFKLL